jgi:multidrug efflux pump
MIGLPAAAGRVPLILSSGGGAAIGVVILFGILAAAVIIVFIVPTAYDLISRGSVSPQTVARKLKQ